MVLWRSRESNLCSTLPGIEPATPRLHKLFVAFPWVETSPGPGGSMICVFII